jgi:hypothetical protein
MLEDKRKRKKKPTSLAVVPAPSGQTFFSPQECETKIETGIIGNPTRTALMNIFPAFHRILSTLHLSQSTSS